MTIAQLSETVLREAQDAGAEIYRIQSAPTQANAPYRLIYAVWPGCGEQHSYASLERLDKNPNIQVEFVNVYNIDLPNPQPPGKAIPTGAKAIFETEPAKRVLNAVGLDVFDSRIALVDSNNKVVGYFKSNTPDFEAHVLSLTHQPTTQQQRAGRGL